ncbi:MAG: phosphoribosylformylglycinamidine synthase [Epulopiscium sp.]|jgi:phosphoribosylformylglycinamidine synthase|nr:phosphoribosylformylglycinamidine synthase [Defluviitalea raffinosedens]MBM7685360.1 phosphoribosylformylglycinamidine synthase [Defluviitalea raffinosedens]MBZ4667229.1 phosphoribosylformylglycinamidine synthase [Defluviitaleaceae bacterium]MDK2787678.1 phosphoribosylformylglycinamidine synthase [Candidatus Epulonipiscium sp.]
MSDVRRIFVQKKSGFDVEAKNLYTDLKENLLIEALEDVRIVNRYDIEGIDEEAYNQARTIIFSEPPVDLVYDEELPLEVNERVFAVEYLPGQYDQRADSAAQCIQILTRKEKPVIRTAKVICLKGNITDEQFDVIKNYCINTIDSREASLEKPETLDMELSIPEEVEILNGFIHLSYEQLENLRNELGLAMSTEDIVFCQTYFRDEEKRDPSITEIRVLDTYWSDHCRHTTFLTKLDNIEIEEGHFSIPIQKAYQEYLEGRDIVYGESKKDICLMDIALMGMKELRKQGKLDDLEVSDEINACSIQVTVDVNGEDEEWLVMFKNETHNHPTEIEPFGGAATCLGGAIRDPLSGRAYVYQAMRVTGSGDPRTSVQDTLPGKLPQRKITTGAAHGYSSYGNQIGLATGHVAEIYDEGYVAKRMEIGAVIAAAPKKNVVRGVPEEGDVIILLGGRTGRDGCGGATGSSKEHTEESLTTCGAEVQKGNAPTERKIQRLFRNPKVSTMIKRCNDFGAGGVSVAIGELADGLEIDLNAVPKKYEGLDGTELAISESQERMAVVIEPHHVEEFIALAEEENLEAVVVAKVTSDNRLKMFWNDKVIVDISREFLNTNGATQRADGFITAPEENKNYFSVIKEDIKDKLEDLKDAWITNLKDLNVCSQKGLVERFDSTIGTGTVLMPFGGKYQLTPAECMVGKIPVFNGETKSGTIMSHGYNPRLSKWSPFHGAVYAIVEAVAKVVAVGGDYKNIRLTLQEYFERLGKDPKRWGKPLASLLGAYYVQKKLGTAAIGGKDSMSGTFKDLDVPPTLTAFAVDMVNVDKVISPEFKRSGSVVIYVPLKRDEFELPDFEELDRNYSTITKLIQEGKILSAHTVKLGGIAEAISKMSFGNKIGMRFTKEIHPKDLFAPNYGSLVLEIEEKDIALFKDIRYILLGETQNSPSICVNNIEIPLEELLKAWEAPLEKVFPTKVKEIKEKPIHKIYTERNPHKSRIKIAKPRIFIPVFPGTNCEDDTQRAFEEAGGIVNISVFKNLVPSHIEESIDQMVKAINNAQIIMIPGGFSAGDEPEGSGKFIATVFRNPRIKEAVMNLLSNRDGLMLGICNGFQALMKLGLLPYGEIRDIDCDCPTLTFNTLGRHVSNMVTTKITSTKSPWFANVEAGDLHQIAVSHGEGRFVASEEMMRQLFDNGQVATQYVDLDGNPTYDIAFNPNGSMNAIEGITSPDGRILGKMGHSERIGTNVAKNIPGAKDQKIFQSGVEYFS